MSAARKLENFETQIAENAHFRLIREADSASGRPVVIKTTSSQQPSKQDIGRLKSEYQILAELQQRGVEGIAKVFDFKTDSHSAVIVMEDARGLPISSLFQDGPMKLDTFYELATQILTIVCAIHDQSVVHCDLKPDNILYNAEKKKIVIVDFGSAKKLVGRGQFQTQVLSATLAFIAPEQTGRVNRRIDHRTDFYTLGVTFYRLLSGQLPFQASDALGWIHSHLAKQAESLHSRKIGVPLSLSRLVEKMMNKAPEDRYQSADGILSDLTKISSLTADSREDFDFVVGSEDHSRRFMLTQKIVGRDSEIATLTSVWQQLPGSQQFISVSGAPGTGKTAVVREFLKQIGSQRGLVSQAKHDSRRSHVPFSAMSDALTSLLEEILRSPPAILETIREKILASLGDAVGALEPLILNLEKLIGPFHKMEDVSLEGARARQSTALELFLGAIIATVGPVTIFLDDVQYIDETSTAVLKRIFSDRRLPGFLLIVAYQTSQVEPEIVQLEGTRFEVRELNLTQVMEFIGETLMMKPEAVRELAEALFSRSGGNPFLTNQIFKDLFDEKNLVPHRTKGWTWNLDSLRAMETAVNVIDLLAVRFSKLQKSVRDVLKVASCFGSQFTVSDLSAINGQPEEANERELNVAVDSGLLFMGDDQSYRFVHERVREFTYKTLKPELRNETHAKLGLKLLNDSNENSLQEQVYVTVAHAVAGLPVIQDPASRIKIAHLCLDAARKAKAAAAFNLVCEYADNGLLASSRSDWNEDGDLLFALYLLKAEAEHLVGKIEQSDLTFGYLRKKIKSPLEKLHVQMVYIRLLAGEGNHVLALKTGLESLRVRGVRPSENPSKVRLLIKILLVHMYFTVRGFPKNAEEESGGSLSPAVLNAELLRLVSQSAYFVNKELFFDFILSLNLRAFRFGLEGDRCNALVLYSLVMAKRLGHYGGAAKTFKIAGALPKEKLSPSGRCIFLFTEAAFLSPWVGSWSETMQMLRNALRHSMQQGDLADAGFSSLYLCFHALFTLENFEAIDEEVSNQLAYIQSHRNQVVFDSALPTQLLIRVLSGQTKSTDTFTSDQFSEEQYVLRIASHVSPNPKAWYAVQKLMALYLMGHIDQAVKYLDDARTTKEHMPFGLINFPYELFSSLVLISQARDLGTLSSARLRRKLAKSLRQLQIWAKGNPQHFDPAALLLSAEIFAIKDKKLLAMETYERASKAARASGHWMMGIVVNESAGRFYSRLDNMRVADTYIRDAIYAAHRWGASAKVGLLAKEFPSAARGRSSSGGQGFTTSQDFLATEQLDLQTATKAALVLNSELNMSELLKKLTLIAVENAAAAKGLLFMKDDSITAGVASPEHPATSGYAIKEKVGTTSSQYPSSIIDHVFHTGEDVALDDARFSEHYAFDPYIRAEQPLSVLCIAIKHKEKVQGVLYMENSAAAGIFNEARMKVLRIVLSQASISIENARLYGEVIEKVRMTAELKTARAVQETLFPAERAEFDGLQISGHYEPATECGGDWWYYQRQGDKIFVYIGDATGHGAPAALMTSAARSAVSLFSELPELSPARAMTLLNRAIYETSKSSMNMTFAICSFDLKKGELVYCNASHELPIIVSTDTKTKIAQLIEQKGETEAFREFRQKVEAGGTSIGPRLGESLASQYEDSVCAFHPGDLIILLSDGLCEVGDLTGKEWGTRRFLRAVFDSVILKQHDAKSVNGDILEACQKFRQNTVLRDDVTLITCFEKPSGSPS